MVRPYSVPRTARHRFYCSGHSVRPAGMVAMVGQHFTSADRVRWRAVAYGRHTHAYNDGWAAQTARNRDSPLWIPLRPIARARIN